MTFDLFRASPPARAPGPNEPCWCGSGKKYKRCHQQQDREGPAAASPAKPPVRSVKRQPLKAGKVTPGRPVPPHIPRPDYASTGKPGAHVGSEVNSPEQIARMRRAAKAAALRAPEDRRGGAPRRDH